MPKLKYNNRRLSNTYIKLKVYGVLFIGAAFYGHHVQSSDLCVVSSVLAFLFLFVSSMLPKEEKYQVKKQNNDDLFC